MASSASLSDAGDPVMHLNVGAPGLSVTRGAAGLFPDRH
jgi:hypothetical protein